MDIGALLLANILSIGSFVGAATWFLRRYISRRIDSVFSERERILEAKIRVAEKYENRILEVALEAVPEIQEVVYRSRVILREIAVSGDSARVEPLLTLWSQLCENLYRYKVFLPEETFDQLHEYKDLLQSLSLMLGAAVQGLALPPGEEANGSRSPYVPEQQLVGLRASLDRIETMYQVISGQLRDMIQGRAGGWVR